MPSMSQPASAAEATRSRATTGEIKRRMADQRGFAHDIGAAAGNLSASGLRRVLGCRQVETVAGAKRPAAQKIGRAQTLAAGPLQLRQGEDTAAAGDAQCAALDADDLSGHAARLGAGLAAPAGDELATQLAVRAGKRVEGAQPSLDRRRRLAPVDRRLRLGDLRRVGHAVVRLSARRQPPAGRAIEDCFAIYKKSDRAAIFAGWRDMNDYMRENKIEPVQPQLAAQVKDGTESR